MVDVYLLVTMNSSHLEMIHFELTYLNVVVVKVVKVMVVVVWMEEKHEMVGMRRAVLVFEVGLELDVTYS